jgi:hypothetical protein
MENFPSLSFSPVIDFSRGKTLISENAFTKTKENSDFHGEILLVFENFSSFFSFFF